jgi:hypothetical protein
MRERVLGARRCWRYRELHTVAHFPCIERIYDASVGLETVGDHTAGAFRIAAASTGLVGGSSRGEAAPKGSALTRSPGPDTSRSEGPGLTLVNRHGT